MRGRGFTRRRVKGRGPAGDIAAERLTGRAGRATLNASCTHERKEPPMYEAPRITEVGSVKDVTLEQQWAFDFDGDLFHKGNAS
ncbi:hypothetical protein GCM10007368_26630 [Isoptericola cucumis]|uniref:Uncharacterized protein n=1 Tax=Isoptericola cucumis TaxID=1776856 RepID=A0ABQ2B9C0_9MICO|nr:hypothetical protein GCM10007368_26630 [Isoptericola cucumis]